jgi:hypothetical protein
MGLLLTECFKADADRNVFLESSNFTTSTQMPNPSLSGPQRNRLGLVADTATRTAVHLYPFIMQFVNILKRELACLIIGEERKRFCEE